MIEGVVTSDREAIIRLHVGGALGRSTDVRAVVDTGFDGWLSLPTDVVERLGLPWQRRSRAVLADGSESVFDVFSGTVLWNGRPRFIAIDCAETDPLVGMSLLWDHEIRILAVNDGEVIIRPISSAR